MMHRTWTRRLSIALPLLLLSAAVAQERPDPVAAARERVAGFLDLFSEVKCTEHVSQEKLSKNGHVEYREQSRFDYLVIAQSSDSDLSIEESRLEEQGATHKKNVPLLVTNGFATLLLVFHPYYKGSFEFSPPETETSNGAMLSKVRFRHIQGRRSPTVLVLRGREYPLSLMGTAWINPTSGEVVRIEADLLDNMDDIGLHVLHSDVSYAPVRFRDMQTAPWLPSRAVIEVQTLRQHWRNVHEFSNYQHFGVDTHASVKSPPQDTSTQ